MRAHGLAARLRAAVRAPYRPVPLPCEPPDDAVLRRGAFPDATDKPSRTILNGKGGRGASRFKHVIKCEDGRYRRLVPDELDQLQGFPRGWTDTGMSDGRRAFCMGNALVTGIPHRIGQALIRSIEAEGGGALL